MATIIPQKLTKGDTIGVIAPSEPISPEQEQKLKAGCAYLEKIGFTIHLGTYLRPEKFDDANTPKRKAKDINDMFADRSINGIICAQGGETANTTLPFIDWSIVEKNPKIFLGLSDITVLLNAIYKKTNLIAFHGNDILWGFGNNLTPYEEK
jgi:muramoyltetrapeptide carboxypeptidase